MVIYSAHTILIETCANKMCSVDKIALCCDNACDVDKRWVFRNGKNVHFEWHLQNKASEREREWRKPHRYDFNINSLSRQCANNFNNLSIGTAHSKLITGMDFYRIYHAPSTNCWILSSIFHINRSINVPSADLTNFYIFPLIFSLIGNPFVNESSSLFRFDWIIIERLATDKDREYQVCVVICQQAKKSQNHLL